MTCLEKYKMDHHGEEPDINGRCPNISGGIDIEDPEYCDCGRSNECTRCWNREVPNTELAPTPIIKDSGERRQFYDADGNPMAVRDIQEGKGRCDLIPLDVLGEYMEDPVPLFLDQFQSDGLVGHLYGVLREAPARVGYADHATMFLEVAKHFEEGAKKYGENNWQKGIPIRCYIDSAIRHYLKLRRGDNDEPHDRAFCWNIICAIWTCKHKPELNEYKEN